MNRECLMVILMGLTIWPVISFGTEANPDTRRPKIHAVQYPKGCYYDRVMVGPDGHEVAVWSSDGRYILGIRQMLPPNYVIVGRMHGSIGANQDNFFSVGGAGLRLHPIRWSAAGDRLYVRVHEPRNRVITVSSEGYVHSGEVPLAPIWDLIDLSAITHGDLNLLDRPEVLEIARLIDGKTFIRGSATLGTTVELLGARRHDLELMKISRRGMEDVGINSGHTRVLTAFPNDSVFRHGVSYIGSSERTKIGQYLPYQLPIVDLKTGKVGGKFGPLQIQLNSLVGLQSGIDQLNRNLEHQGGLILDASLSGQTLMALAAFHNGDRKLIRVDGQDISERLICKKPPLAENLRTNMVRIDRRGRETTSPESPILVHYTVDGTGPRDAVLYLHGGPGGTLADDTYWFPPSLRLLRPGRDIIAVEYAGSLGGGRRLTERLADDGMRALRNDMDSVAAWISNRGYRRIYLLAGSFGSVPAWLLLSRHRNLVTASFQLTPVLKVEDPHEWAARGTGLRPTNPNTQLAYELASFGDPKRRGRFANELRLAVIDAKLNQNDHLYFGGFDEISKAEHLPSNARPNVIVIPRAGHAILGGESRIWSDIESYMK